MSTFTSLTGKSSRLQSARDQYESLLIRAGEIIEHVHDSDRENSFDGGSIDDSTTYQFNSSGSSQTNINQDSQQWLQNIRHPEEKNIKNEDITNMMNSISNFGENSNYMDSLPAYNPNVESIEEIGNDSADYVINNGDITDDDKTTIILTLQAEVNRLKHKLDMTLNAAEETVTSLYDAHSKSEKEFKTIEVRLSNENSRLRDENEMLKSKLSHAQSSLVVERDSLLKATHLIHRLHSRQKIVTHGLLPQKSTNHGSKSKKNERSHSNQKSRSSASTSRRSHATQSPMSNREQLSSLLVSPNSGKAVRNNLY